MSLYGMCYSIKGSRSAMIISLQRVSFHLYGKVYNDTKVHHQGPQRYLPK
jgi:hypothetical protein